MESIGFTWVIPWENSKKKWENGTKGLKFAKSVFFPDSRHDSKKKNVLQQSSKISIFFFWSNF
jgi:hypothetical protein